MEGLITARINPVRPYCRRHQSYFVSSYTPQVAKRVIATPIGMMKKHPKLLHSVAASVQPLENSEAGCLDNTLPSKDVLEVWRNADAVCFDVDSTVCLDEGIDELAEFCGAGKAVAEWTARAMGGSVPFEEALAARLSLFNPSLSQVHEFLQKQPPRISPGIDELIKKLKAKSTAVYLVSGGFRQMINPVASILGIPPENIFANQLLFGNSGEFRGFDANEPTSRSGGKATAVEQIKKTQFCRFVDTSH
ncbi:phosphoserine phosphatase, chloroplastic isoform X2 [Rhododendron vialii]|uniref:phosphoserine phosphatase, chloroplastic isoform X2 n=1 Tax=Rhododendron vialii TaxID=182163 RepID=UPI0026602C2D|nr:phosphoserine phosphatase, chloroplastic isoform X2 [Rhododendron vialii]